LSRKSFGKFLWAGLLSLLPIIVLIGVFSFQKREICKAELALKQAGLVDVQVVDPQIQVELRYSGVNNFLGKDIYGCLSRAYLQPQAARKLKMASEFLRKDKPGFSLLVYDAARPKWAQQALWDNLQKPEKSKHIYVANPKKGSIHNFGMAVDLTIADAKGIPLDMGTPYDFFGPLAQPRLEESLLGKGDLTKVQVANRRLLRKVMAEAGFTPITSEWWHFNASSLSRAKASYPILN
jgi:D-alanyl-D-alanine dipeptidase